MNLSAGVCHAMMNHQPLPPSSNTTIVLQIADITKLKLKLPQKERNTESDVAVYYKAVLWDGACACVGIFSKWLSDRLVAPRTIDIGSVVHITQCCGMRTIEGQRPVMFITAVAEDMLSVMMQSVSLIASGTTTSTTSPCTMCVETVMRSCSSQSLLRRDFSVLLRNQKRSRGGDRVEPADIPQEAHHEFTLVRMFDSVGANNSINFRGTVKAVKSLRRSIHTRHGTDVLKSEVTLEDDEGDIVDLTIWGDALHGLEGFDTVLLEVGARLVCYGVHTNTFRDIVGLATRKGTRLCRSVIRESDDHQQQQNSNPLVKVMGPSHHEQSVERYFTLMSCTLDTGDVITLELAGSNSSWEVCVHAFRGCKSALHWLQDAGLELGDKVTPLLGPAGAVKGIASVAGEYAEGAKWLVADIHRMLIE